MRFLYTVVTLLVLVGFLLVKVSYPDSRKSVVGVVKQVYVVNRAVPNRYAEMKRIVEEFSQIQDWALLVEMGDIYARGFFPYLQPNEKIAKSCYEVAEKCPDPVVRGNASAKMSSMFINPVTSEDRRGGKIDQTYGESVVKIARKFMTPPKRAKVPTNYQTDLERRNSTRRKVLNSTARDRFPAVTRRRRRDLRQRLNIGGGAQNTHDHGVTSATKTNIKTLADDFKKSGKSFRKDDDIINEAVQMCNNVKTSELSRDQAADAHHVVVSLSPDEYSGTGVSQIQILDTVLWKISTIPDSDVRKCVKETLCKRLSSGFENGVVVCGTGKVSRIISVFEGVLEDAQKSVSIKIVEREIAQLASKVRDDFLDSVGPIGRTAYESDNSVPEYAVSMSKILRDKVRQEYVDKLNMKSSVITPLVEVYANAY